MLKNPLIGESEGDEKHNMINNEYKEYVRQNMERIRERSTSKRMSRHLQKRQEAQSKSPHHEMNIYSTK